MRHQRCGCCFLKGNQSHRARVVRHDWPHRSRGRAPQDGSWQSRWSRLQANCCSPQDATAWCKLLTGGMPSLSSSETRRGLWGRWLPASLTSGDGGATPQAASLSMTPERPMSSDDGRARRVTTLSSGARIEGVKPAAVGGGGSMSSCLEGLVLFVGSPRERNLCLR